VNDSQQHDFDQVLLLDLTLSVNEKGVDGARRAALPLSFVMRQSASYSHTDWSRREGHVGKGVETRTELREHGGEFFVLGLERVHWGRPQHFYFVLRRRSTACARTRHQPT